MITAERIGRREQKRYELRQALRDAAWRLVDERGYGSITVEDIATAAGTSIATFYRNFPSKEAVLTRRWLSSERLALLQPEIDADHGVVGVVTSLFHAYGEMVNTYSISLVTRLKVINQDPALQRAMSRGRLEDQTTLAEIFAGASGQPTESLALRMAAALTITARATTMARWAELDAGPPLRQLLAETAQVLTPTLGLCEATGAFASTRDRRQ